MISESATLAVDEGAPRITVEQSGLARLDEPGRWHITWQIHNLEREGITLRAARLPHGKFKSEERIFEKGLAVPGGANATVEFSVNCQGAPGDVVDNAFLLIEIDWLQDAWRVFVRFQVVFDEAAEPVTQTELITAQRVGFSAWAPRVKSEG
jgi:hypothetical protein